MNRVLWRMILSLLLVLPAAAVTADTEPEYERFPVFIDAASVHATGDGEHILTVSGSLGTGCDEPVQVEMIQDGLTLDVRIFQYIAPGTACTTMLIPYQDEIRLPSITTFERLIVNGDEIDFDPHTMPVTTSPDSPFKDRYDMQSVELVSDMAGDRIVLLVSGQLNGRCGDLPAILREQIDGRWLRVELYREIPANVRCTRDLPPFEQRIALDMPPDYLSTVDDEHRRAILEINDYVGLLEVVVTSDGDTLLTLTEIERQLMDVTWVEAAVTTDRPRKVIFTASGTMGLCNPTTNYRPVDGAADYNWEVYAVIFPGPQPMCAVAPDDFVQTIRIPAPEAGVYTFNINGVSGEVRVADAVSSPPPTPPDRPAPTTRVPHVIESVDIIILESFPEQINLHVTGYIPDGCKFPTQTDILREGDVFTISIYRELPEGVMCPMVVEMYDEVIPLGGIGLGDYTFIVNGLVVEMNP